MASEGGATDEAGAGVTAVECRTWMPDRVLVFVLRAMTGPGGSLKEQVI